MKRYSVEDKMGVVHMFFQERKTVKQIVEEISDGPKESTIKQYRSKGSMAFMESNNDAIPSWSGYSYQGKMVILCTIQKINELFNSGFEEWKVQLEKLQDFVFIKDKEIDSLWQVKAKLSSTRHQYYEDAMAKLLSDKVSSGALAAKCWLVTAVDIANWEEDENKYKGKVELYKYENEVVSIQDVPTKIQEELEKLLGKLGVAVDKELAYLQLCSLLDDKVAEFHKAGKISEYLIDFCEFIQRIKDADLFGNRIGDLKMQEKVYENIAQKVQEGFELHCKTCEKGINGECERDNCAVNRNNYLVSNTNLGNYMKSIRPDIESKNIVDCIISDADEYTESICYSISTAPSVALEKNDDIISLACYKGDLNVIPTMLDLCKSNEELLSRKLGKIERNEWLKKHIGKKVLLAKTNNLIYGTKSSKFTTIQLNDLLNEKDYSEERIGIKYCLDDVKTIEKATEICNSITIIDRDHIVRYFREEDEDE